MIINKALYPRDDVDRLYVSRKEGGKGLASIKDGVDVSIQWLEDCIKSVEEDWIHPLKTIKTIQVSTKQK